MEALQKSKRKRKTEFLEPSERVAFKNWVDAQPTKEDARMAIGPNGITLNTLNKVLDVGKGAPETIAMVREKIK